MNNDYLIKPKLIILIRHGQSQSNKDQSILLTVPNHKIGLTDLGIKQSYQTASNLLNILNSVSPPSKPTQITFHSSPYQSTRQTLRCILQTIDTYNNNNPLQTKNINNCHLLEIFNPCKKRKNAFWKRERTTPSNNTNNNNTNDDQFIYEIKEDPRLREQDIGNFIDINQINDILTIRQNYGQFFYRFPQGENASDVYDRVSNFQESFFRSFHGKNGDRGDNKDNNDIRIIISHEIFIKVFLMKWFHWTFEEFDNLNDILNGQIILMELDQKSNRYILKSNISNISNF